MVRKSFNASIPLRQIFVNLDTPFQQFNNEKNVRNKTERKEIFTRVVMKRVNAKAASRSLALIFCLRVFDQQIHFFLQLI